ncbi:FAD-dependent monooxygenase [Nocardia mexicana]|uniref:2-polyprenyl-6-methoxyphenol hydroxylase-like FAD-dependent oxidoreductase n=1 Tax=Nocardia mexicana TaxID=279262 RepID=A0A370HEC5_9NOCA|nr:FAD-dependent monooxygenase [Nocardia mexicana]RDI55608.1 2-polyprenyl-6-methoxyphenol hydroxylase-like FAD-dependent oxidoreductase [Nocardia mexicana]
MNSSAPSPHILVSGGGIAGNAVALQLLRSGIRVTVVERAAAPRPGGQAVDLRGPSREVAERMGLMPGIRKYQLEELGISYIDSRGRNYANMTMEDFDGQGPVAEIEITRGDLNQVLLDEVAAAGGELDYRYGEWIEALAQDADGVDVTFSTGRTERFDLVVGADGVHSATRRLAFGPEEQFSTYLGGYASFFTIPTPPGVKPGWFAMQLVPSAAVGIRPDHDPSTSKAILTLLAEPDPALRRDTAAQQRLIHGMLGDAGWHSPAILAAMATTPDFYFDELARIDMPSLAAGRVTLAGDAGYCGSPMTGMGTAMAIVGAYILAGEIAATPGDLPAALRRYEDRVTPFLDKAKELPGGGIKMMLSPTNFGTALRRTANRAMMSRLMRPVTKKIFFGKTDSYELPTY